MVWGLKFKVIIDYIEIKDGNKRRKMKLYLKGYNYWIYWEWNSRFIWCEVFENI